MLKVTPDTTNWITYAGGTSDGVEPVWPSAPPWTVLDGSVTWTPGSAWRQQVSAGLLTVLNNFAAANPTLLKGIATARPKSMGNFDLPGAFIDGGDETVTYNEGVRIRHLATSVTAVTMVPDNQEAQTGMDALLDGLIDAFTAGLHAGSGASLVQATSIRQVDVTDLGMKTLGYQFPFDNYVAEGRN